MADRMSMIFPFAYLANQQSSWAKGGRQHARFGTASSQFSEIEPPDYFVVLTPLSFFWSRQLLSETKQNKDRVNAATSIAAMTGETTQNESDITTTAPVAETQQTQVAVIQRNKKQPEILTHKKKAPD